MISRDETLYWASPRQESQSIVRTSEEELKDGNEATASNSLEKAGHCSTCAHSVTNHKPRKIRRLRHPTESFLLVNIMHVLAAFFIHALLFFVCCPVVLAICPIIFLLRKLILFLGSTSLCCNSYEPQRQMALEDAMWLHGTEENESHFSSIFLLLDGKLTIDEVRQLIADKWMCYCRLNASCTYPKLLEFGVEFSTGYIWRKVNNFRLENYVISQLETSTLSTGDINENRTDLTYFQPTVQPDMALWRVTFFPEVNETGDSGLLFQVHNSISDIFPIVRLTLESFGYKTVYLKDSCYNFKRRCLYICAALVGPLYVLRRLLMARDTAPLCSCVSRSLNCAGRRNERMLWSGRVDMQVVKRIKDITRTNVDVVILSCLAGALRSYMKLCGVEQPQDIRVCLHLDARPQHAGLQLDNKFAPVFVNLPVGTEGAVPRLWETKKRTNTFGHVVEKFVMLGFIRLCSVLLPSRVARWLVEFLAGKASCAVTYILGPSAPLYLNGKMAKLMTFWSPRISNAGLSLSFITHGHQLRLGMVSSAANMDNPKLLLLEFEKEVVELAVHLSSRTLPSHLRMRARVVQPLKVEEHMDKGETEPL